jgi:hypothetical protein
MIGSGTWPLGGFAFTGLERSQPPHCSSCCRRLITPPAAAALKCGQAFRSSGHHSSAPWALCTPGCVGTAEVVVRGDNANPGERILGDQENVGGAYSWGSRGRRFKSCRPDQRFRRSQTVSDTSDTVFSFFRGPVGNRVFSGGVLGPGAVDSRTCCRRVAARGASSRRLGAEVYEVVLAGSSNGHASELRRCGGRRVTSSVRSGTPVVASACGAPVSPE